jgi:hypothetical protein
MSSIDWYLNWPHSAFISWDMVHKRGHIALSKVAPKVKTDIFELENRGNLFWKMPLFNKNTQKYYSLCVISINLWQIIKSSNSSFSVLCRYMHSIFFLNDYTYEEFIIIIIKKAHTHTHTHTHIHTSWLNYALLKNIMVKYVVYVCYNICVCLFIVIICCSCIRERERKYSLVQNRIAKKKFISDIIISIIKHHRALANK